MIDYAFSFLLDLIVLILSLTVLIINWYFRKEQKSLLATSFVMTLIFCGGHFFMGWLSTIDDGNSVEFKYQARTMLYVAAFSIMFLVYLFVESTDNDRLVSDILWILLFGAILNLLMEIDQNHFPLNQLDKLHLVNTEQQPEKNYYNDMTWWFWGVYSAYIHVSDYLIITTLLLGERWSCSIWHPVNLLKRKRA